MKPENRFSNPYMEDITATQQYFTPSAPYVRLCPEFCAGSFHHSYILIQTDGEKLIDRKCSSHIPLAEM